MKRGVYSRTEVLPESVVVCLMGNLHELLNRRRVQIITRGITIFDAQEDHDLPCPGRNTPAQATLAGSLCQLHPFFCRVIHCHNAHDFALWDISLVLCRPSNCLFMLVESFYGQLREFAREETDVTGVWRSGRAAGKTVLVVE